jgi:hypothetical protein
VPQTVFRSLVISIPFPIPLSFPLVNFVGTRSMKQYLCKFLALTFICLGFAFAPFPMVALAQTSVPMEIYNESDGGNFYLNAPSGDDSQPAFGGKLHLYDVYIAKMVEVTNQFCQHQFRNAPSHSWSYGYGAKGRDRKYKRFTISCELAEQLRQKYGLGLPERTTIAFSRGGRSTNRIFDLPTLDITGDSKVNQWLKFTEGFAPETR